MKIADSLMASLHHLKVPSCSGGCFSDSRTQNPCEMRWSIPGGTHEDLPPKLGVWRNLPPQAERDSNLYNLYSIIVVGVFSSKSWDWWCWRESPEFGLMRALWFSGVLSLKVSLGVRITAINNVAANPLGLSFAIATYCRWNTTSFPYHTAELLPMTQPSLLLPTRASSPFPDNFEPVELAMWLLKPK